MKLNKKSNVRQKTTGIPYILGFILIITLLISICVIIYQTLHQKSDIEKLQKSVNDLQTSLYEGTLEPNDKSDGKIFLTQMENQYNSFKDTVTIVMTLTVVLIGLLSIIFPLYNFTFTKDTLNTFENQLAENTNILRNYENQLAESAKALRNYADSFKEEILVMEYFFDVNDPYKHDPYTPEPKLTTDIAKAYFYFVEGNREFKAAREASSDTEKSVEERFEQSVEHSLRAVKALSKAINIQSTKKEPILLDAKAYHLLASIYMALANTYNDKDKCIEFHKEAHDIINKGLGIFNDEPRLLFAQCANNIDSL